MAATKPTTTKTWTVTMKTGVGRWSTVELEALSASEAVEHAKRLIGGRFVKAAPVK
ncbi:MAG TPA: hypothetical protein VIG48_03680 [Jatrophihabitans sp.]|jgi:hypothetical protein